ncbi:Mannose-1-phosphate guanylyltransferase 1 [bioreactor metagenome]|uniref:Mannose-1-phosphate guanylyltransferase 1 n=1 Tax=bioreactor metagenome TaxID=1076179 RepID=A0A645DTW0_9ZZZZ
MKYVLDISKNLLGTNVYAELFSNYENLAKESFDYAVVEKETNMHVVKFDGEWVDLGSWNTLTETMSERIIGTAMMDNACQNVHIINELEVPILVMGLHDVVVSASPDGILVSDKNQSGYLKQYVDKLNHDTMFAEKSWGCFRVIDAESESMTIKVTIKLGDSMNYHSHDHRDEVWVVVSGKGRTIVNDVEQSINPGDVIIMKSGCRHTVIADTELKLIEVQIGKDITVHDKKKYPLKKLTVMN